MKPRNFVVNIILVLLCVAQIVLTFVAPSIPFWPFFIGLAGILFLIPDWILKPKHRAIYIVYKSLAILLFLLVGVASGFFGFIFGLIFGIAKDLAEGCGGTISHTELDTFYANYCFIISPVFLIKVAMVITDLAVYKKDRRKLEEQ